MTKKLLALLLAMCMIFSVCSVTILAEEATGDTEQSTDAADATTGSTEASEEESTQEEADGATEGEGTEDDDTTEENSANISLNNSYLPNATVVIKGTVTGNVSGVIVEVICEEDDVEFEETVNASKFESTGVKLPLDNATVGAEYLVKIYNFDDETEILCEDSFLIKKGTPSYDNEDDGSNKVTIWVEGLTDRYIDETVISLDVLDNDERNVFDLAEYLLEDVDRNYKDNKKKITAIASTETGSTYTLKDGSTSKNYDDCVWGFFLNGIAIYEDDWTEVEINGGDEIILYYGEPGQVGYPIVTITPDDGIAVKDELEVLVENQITDPETGEITKEPIKSAKVYFMKRGATSKGSGKSTGSDGVYSQTVTSSFVTSYQGGEVMVAYYQTSSKPIKMVSVKKDLETDRDGSMQAYVRIEGAHKTLLERTKSAKIEEYDLYNFLIEVLEDEDIEYEVNDDENNFTYLESKTTSGYSNENGDITRDSGWYVVVNDEIYTPDDDLEDVEIYANDEILLYFGDEDTIPVVYYKVDGELETEEKVYVYFYADAEMTEPIDDFDVYFDGDEYSDKRLNTNSDGRVTLPTVEYRGTYELYWGEQVGVKADECPTAVFGSVDLKYTGTAKTTTPSTGTTTPKIEYECDYCGELVSKVYTVEYDGEELDVCRSCQNELEVAEDETWENTTKPEDEDPTWNEGDYTEPPTEPEPATGPSKYYPDPNIDAWAVENVNKAYEYGLMSGTALGWFEPQREITRAEFTTIVCRILGLDTEAPYEQKFADVKPSDWYYGYVMAAYNAGYVNGMSETSFAPTNYITREEIAVMVSRILNVTGNADDVNQFTDGASVAAWAKIYVAAVNQTGIMTGDQFGQFLPKNQVNRQTVATICVRLYEYLGNN